MGKKEKSFVSSVIYVHNAGSRISAFLEMIIDTMEDNFENSEIICVNDCSTDNSVDEIKKSSSKASSTSISVVNMSCFHGLELAMNAGVDLAIGDFIFEFDNTFDNYGSAEIMKAYWHSLEGFDIVSASPDKKESITSSLFYWLFENYSNNQFKMTTESFRVLSRRAINRVKSINTTIPYRKALYANSGLKTDVIKFCYIGKFEKKLDKKEEKYRTGLAIDILLILTEIGYSFAKYMTIIMMFISLFMVIYSIFTYFLIHPVEGWTTTILFLSVAFSGLFGIMTIIIKYLQLIVNLLFKRSHYNYESIEKLTN